MSDYNLAINLLKSDTPNIQTEVKRTGFLQSRTVTISQKFGAKEAESRSTTTSSEFKFSFLMEAAADNLTKLKNSSSRTPEDIQTSKNILLNLKKMDSGGRNMFNIFKNKREGELDNMLKELNSLSATPQSAAQKAPESVSHASTTAVKKQTVSQELKINSGALKEWGASLQQLSGKEETALKKLSSLHFNDDSSVKLTAGEGGKHKLEFLKNDEGGCFKFYKDLMGKRRPMSIDPTRPIQFNSLEEAKQNIGNLKSEGDVDFARVAAKLNELTGVEWKITGDKGEEKLVANIKVTPNDEDIAEGSEMARRSPVGHHYVQGNNGLVNMPVFAEDAVSENANNAAAKRLLKPIGANFAVEKNGKDVTVSLPLNGINFMDNQMS